MIKNIKKIRVQLCEDDKLMDKCKIEVYYFKNLRK